MELNMSYILVMYIYAGMLAKGDSVTLLSVPNFKTEHSCMIAGKAGEKFVSGTSKEYKFMCVPQ
jgi:hypothetical protein